MKIQDQICHKIPNNLLRNNSEEPSYIYDNATAIEKRLKNNAQLIKEHMIALTQIMNNNPYPKSYKHLHQISNIQNLPNYILYPRRK